MRGGDSVWKAQRYGMWSQFVVLQQLLWVLKTKAGYVVPWYCLLHQVRETSRKPDEIYGIIERIFPTPRTRPWKIIISPTH